MNTQRRERVVSIRVTEEQHEALAGWAEGEGMHLADYCRSVLLRPRVVDRLYLLTLGLAEGLLPADEFEALRAAVEDESAGEEREEGAPV